MTVSQIIHVDSTYRDRLLYPNPADFVVEYGSPTNNNMFNMRNPVTAQLPVYNFVFPYVSTYSNSIDFLSTGTIIANSSLKIRISGGNENAIILNSDDMMAIFGSSIQKQSYDFLSNLYFVYGSVSPYSLSRITSFDSLTNVVTLENPITIDLSTLAYCYIYNDSYVNSNTMSIVLSGQNEDMKNYIRLQGLYLYNATTGQELPVKVSSNEKFIIQNVLNQVLTNWSVNDFYMLFLTSTTINTLLPFANNGNSYVSRSIRSLRIIESSPLFTVNNSIYYLYHSTTNTLSNISITITKINESGKIVLFDIISRGYDINMNTTYYIEDFDVNNNRLYAVFGIQDTYQSFMVSGNISLSQNTFFTPFAFTPLFNHNDTYQNDQISYNVFPVEYNEYINMTSYVPQIQNISGSAMIYEYYHTEDGNTIIYTTTYEEITLTLLDKSYTNNWWNGVMLSTVSKDQCVPLNYTGSTVSQSQLTCYEIQLLNLILPNLELNSTQTLTSFFPYLFVEFTNATTMTRNVNNLYTNNQYGQSALFAVPISDVNSPTTSQFLNLNCATIQTVKFKPNDSLHFRVFLTNGRTFTPTLKDTLPPMIPNALVQISAIFSIKKID